jgi:hypothetical protein
MTAFLVIFEGIHQSRLPYITSFFGIVVLSAESLGLVKLETCWAVESRWEQLRTTGGVSLVSIVMLTPRGGTWGSSLNTGTSNP